jgi:hypothetical protein
VQVDERRLPLHGEPQPHVVPVCRIGAAVAVAEKPAVLESIVVGAIPTLDRRRGVDGERNLGEDGRLEDPLRSDQGHPGALEVEPALQDRMRDGALAEAATLLGQELERAEPDGGVEVPDHVTLNTFITSSPRWLMTFTAMRPDFGLAKGREVSLCRVAQAASSISALRVVLRAP